MVEKNGRLAYIVFPVAGFNGSICIRGSLKIDGLLEMLSIYVFIFNYTGIRVIRPVNLIKDTNKLIFVAK